LTGSYFGFPSTTGNVSLVNDIYAGGTGGVDTPNSDLNALNASRGYLCYSFKNSSTAVPTQSMLDIHEYNSSFNDADGRPILVNQAKTVEVPA